jgi:hypothetical protein
MNEDVGARGLAAQEILGEGRSVVRALGLGGQGDDPADGTLRAQRLGGPGGGEAAAPRSGRGRVRWC